jgi:uncharacterized protein (TIGR02246 family)
MIPRILFYPAFRFLFSLVVVCLLVLIPAACTKAPTADREEVRASMIALMNSYIDALKERNAERITNYFLNSPEFVFYAEGKRQGYDDIVAQVRDLFPNLKSYESKWDTIYVSVLNSDAVAAVAPFHEVLTDKNGVETRLKGEVTWIAVRAANEWKFSYAHATYQPDTAK